MSHSHHDSHRAAGEAQGEGCSEDLLLTDLGAAELSGEDCDASHLPSFTASLYPRMPF